MRLYLMRTGTVAATGAPIPVYLIETDGGCRILVDSGYPRERAGAYRTNPTEPVRVDATDTVDSQLARIGIATADIDYVVCSHFDPDHAGNHDLFPRARFVVQEEHYRSARAGTPRRIAAGRARWDRPELRYDQVRGDVPLVAGVELVESSGHVPGHQSVLVSFAGRAPMLLAVDAIPTTEALDAAHRPIYPFDVDEIGVRAGTRKLVQRAREEGAEIICGHDAAQWRTLRTSPDSYC